MNDETFYRLLDKEALEKCIDELAREVHTKCGMVLIDCINFSATEELKKLNDGPVMEMSNFCTRISDMLIQKIREVDKQRAEMAREAMGRV